MLSDLETLRFYRDEVKHEFNLLAMRSTMLVMCQSFLVVPYGILNTAANFRGVIVPTFLTIVIGMFTVLVLLAPINAAHRTLEKWILKQRMLIKHSEELNVLALDRDKIPGVEENVRKDREHQKSLAFSRYGPWAFFFFWCGCAVWTSVRWIAGF